MGKPITTKGQLCECGCGEYAKPGNRFIFNHHMRGRFGEDHANFGKKFPKHSEYMKKNNPAQKPGVGKRISEAIKGKNHYYYGKARSEETKRKISEANKGKKKHTKKHLMVLSKRCLNGHAAHMVSCNHNPSKPQVELYKLVKLIYPEEAVLNYQSLNYAIDIAIPEYMIAIEYDGSYWHKGREVADKSRQDKLEANGWKFLRYVDYVPPMNQLIKDLQQIEDH